MMYVIKGNTRVDSVPETMTYLIDKAWNKAYPRCVVLENWSRCESKSPHFPQGLRVDFSAI